MVGLLHYNPCLHHTCSAWVHLLWQAAGDAQLISAWKEAWHARGWNTRVLTAADAAAHPQYYKLREQFVKLPTVLNKEYELACFLRCARTVLARAVS